MAFEMVKKMESTNDLTILCNKWEDDNDSWLKADEQSKKHFLGTTESKNGLEAMSKWILRSEIRMRSIQLHSCQYCPNQKSLRIEEVTK